jgi:hypothetical protein
LEDVDGLGNVFETVLTKVDERVAFVDEGSGGMREDDLTAMSRCSHASGKVDVFADVALLREEWRSCVQADPKSDRSGHEPLCDRLGGFECVWRRREGDEERVALGVDLDTASSDTGFAHDSPVRSELLGVGLGAELVEELGRALDVRE